MARPLPLQWWMLWSLPRATTLAGVVLAAAAFESVDHPQADAIRVPATTPRSTRRTATGTMTYDPESRVLTIRSATGSTALRVAPDARVWLGRRCLPLDELASHGGAQATVAWSEVDGVRTTHTVRLLEPRAAGGK